MKAEVKAQWVKDLRSGQFEQGKGYLNRADSEGEHSYCCLGVLCEQAVRAGVIPAPEPVSGTYYYLDDDYSASSGNMTGESFIQDTALPRKVAEWAGNVNEEGRVRDDVIIRSTADGLPQLSAIGANDGIGSECLTFAQIADLIEQYVPVTE